MSTISQEVKGTAEKLAGTAERRAGEFIGDPLMQAKGETRQALGHARVEVAGAVGRIRSKVERAAQTVLKGISAMAGSTATHGTKTEAGPTEPKTRE